MTPYRPEDLAGDWEFKILRSATGAFRRPDRLARVLEEEARSGWVLVEKFDNGRLRLKRPTSARTGPGDRTGIDPYRTYIGPSDNQFALVIVAVVIVLFLLLAVGVRLLR